MIDDYSSVAGYYDLIHAEFIEDLDFVVKLVATRGDPVLDLGCGTGRLMLPLAKSGAHVWGVDSSKHMLDLAVEKINRESAYVQARMTLINDRIETFRLDRRFKVALFSLNTFMHLNAKSAKEALKNIASHLDKGACLYIDVDNPFEVAEPADDSHIFLEEVFTEKESGDVILHKASSWVDVERQIRHVTWMFEASPQRGGPVRRTVFQTDFHFYYPHQLEILLSDCGFGITDVYGDYSGESFAEDSPVHIILATKR